MLELPKGALDVEGDADLLRPFAPGRLVERFALLDAAAGSSGTSGAQLSADNMTARSSTATASANTPRRGLTVDCALGVRTFPCRS